VRLSLEEMQLQQINETVRLNKKNCFVNSSIAPLNTASYELHCLSSTFISFEDFEQFWAT
jgi:hypothetical protein